MKRLSFQWIGLTAAAALLAAGCAAGPQRAPNRTPPNVQSNITTTTGDADSCAIALGNTVPTGTITLPGAAGRTLGTGAPEATANGVIIGNVALVALPTADNLPTTPPAGTPGAVPGATAPGTTGAAPGATAPGTTGAAPGTAGAATPPAPMGTPGTTGTTTAPPGAKGTPITGAVSPTDPAAAPAPGANTDTRYTAPAPGGTATTATLDTDAVERVRTACDRVADIRVVNAADDRRRLAEIASAMRQGRPITDFMADLSGLTQRAVSVGGGRNANRAQAAPAAPGAPAAPAPAAPAAPRGMRITPAPRLAPGPRTPGTYPDATPTTPQAPTTPATPATP